MSIERRHHRNEDVKQNNNDNKLLLLKHPKFLLALYAAGIAGALIQILGAQWDVSWHVLGIVETFFTPPHTVMYSGIAFSLLSALIALLYYHRTLLYNRERNRFLLHGFIIALAGSGLQLFAGQFDYWWHDNFGFDPFLFTPSHTPLIIGFFLNGIGMWIGVTYLTRCEERMSNLASRESFSRRFNLLQILAVLSLVALWYDLSTLVYLFTDDEGIAYTFQLDMETFTEQTGTTAFIISVAGTAAIGSIMLIAARSTLKFRGAATVVAALLIGTSIAFDIGFRAIVLNGSEEGIALAYFIPFYVSFLAPVVLFDILAGKKRLLTAKEKPNTTTAIGWLILTSVLLGPVGTFLDSWHSVALWIESDQMLLPWLIPMFAGGLAAGLIWIGFNKTLLNKLMTTTTTTRIQEAADSGNPTLPTETNVTKKE